MSVSRESTRPISEPEAFALIEGWVSEGSRLGIVLAGPDSRLLVVASRAATLEGGLLVVRGEGVMPSAWFAGGEFRSGPISLIPAVNDVPIRPSGEGLHVSTPAGDWLFVSPSDDDEPVLSCGASSSGGS